MTEINENQDHQTNEEKIKDFLGKKFAKEQKNSFDSLSIVAQILNLGGNKDITYSLIHKLGIISKMKNQEQKDTAFEQILDYINTSDELKNLKLVDTKSVANYIRDNKDSILSFFDDFEKLTYNKEVPDVNTLKFICESDVLYTLHDTEVDKNILDNLFSSKLLYNQQALSLEKDLDLMEKEYENIQRANWGQYPDNSIEIAEDVGIIAVTAIAAAFPPFLIFAGIIHLLHANNNELTNECAKQYQEGKQNLKKYIMEEQQKNSAKDVRNIRNEATKKSKEVLKSLNEKLPKPLRSSVGAYLDIVSNATIIANQNLRRYSNQLTLCNLDMNQLLVPNLLNIPQLA